MMGILNDRCFLHVLVPGGMVPMLLRDEVLVVNNFRVSQIVYSSFLFVVSCFSLGAAGLSAAANTIVGVGGALVGAAIAL